MPGGRSGQRLDHSFWSEEGEEEEREEEQEHDWRTLLEELSGRYLTPENKGKAGLRVKRQLNHHSQPLEIWNSLGHKTYVVKDILIEEEKNLVWQSRKISGSTFSNVSKRFGSQPLNQKCCVIFSSLINRIKNTSLKLQKLREKKPYTNLKQWFVPYSNQN